MKRSFIPLWWCTVLLLAMGPRASCVWPPSTSLEPVTEASYGAGSEAMNPKPTALGLPLIDKLEADECRLQAILQEIKQDEEALKQSAAPRRAHRQPTTAERKTGED